ncbi:MAG: chemotaxis protein CheB [Fluviicoccus sp.]|uniref:chemotaxis protein CheB n=1 Tax=Fluviicoccus sp. TaxID=2003552 RepID=UPI00271E8623|nr:chemotaxis protein CheB [Fluviicoccus sp.]MDO8331396.1 chemotaxis protein CheB [Fluviicoccus sp.]
MTSGKEAAASPVKPVAGDPGQPPPRVPVDRISTGFPIVGIGASAGGLAAFEAFFAGMPTDRAPGMAFVLVQHLAPDHQSILAELMQRCTRMTVYEVVDGMTVQVNCAYIIPPNRDMAFLNGTLQLLEPAEPRGHRQPIDFLFRSLAEDQRERAIGIVLSGTGSDGSQGLRAIKGEGGMVMVQTPESSAFDGMPRSALATGTVDFELAPADMPAQLMAYVAHAFSKPHRPARGAGIQHEGALKKVFVLLRNCTGHDFSQYKPSTILRRIERRMAVHQVETLEGYVKLLQQTPVEVDALFHDLLIGVTSFFRDPDAFQALEAQALAKIIKGKSAGEVIRVWCCGCSTGEEAYSLAILLKESLERLKQNNRVQIFATDMDSRAIGAARAGVYLAGISADITPERLARFFTPEADGCAYRVHKEIRDMLVFSEHDVIKNPPFSRLDLITCRNLLIYLDTDLQRKLIALFHYALSAGGVLFLGSSETVGECGDLFAVLDRKSKVFQRKEDFQGAQRAALGRFMTHEHMRDLTLPSSSPGKAVQPVKPSLRELVERTLVEQLAPAGALVNSQGDILYLYGRTGMYLEPTPGEAGINNILKMAREGLRRELTTVLRKAVAGKERIRVESLRVKTNGHFSLVNLSVCPVVTGPSPAFESDLFLVILDEVPEPAAGSAAGLPAGTVDDGRGADAGAMIAELNAELQAKEEYLQAANEELETANEELKSSNEEMQSVNEELQSTNEELETSKEELQSINEELTTVNTELQTKVADLSRANNDMNNLLAGTGIGTIFVDHNLRILRFTPAATQIINLILSDVGRPVGHIVSNLKGYDSLVSDAQTVLSTLILKEIDVQTTEGKIYTMRILPYRTLDNVIEGVVITFVDISEMVRTREALHKANDLLRLAVVVRDAYDAITVQDLSGRIIAWNPGAERLYGWTEAEALQMNERDRTPPDQKEKSLSRALLLSQAETLEPFQTRRLAKDGTLVDISQTSTALFNAAGQMYAIATTERAKDGSHSPKKETPDDRS